MFTGFGFDPFSDPFFTDPLASMPVFSVPLYTEPSRRRGRGQQRAIGQQQQGQQGQNQGALSTAGSTTALTPQAEDAGWLSFNNLLAEPLNFQLQEKDKSYEIIARRPPLLRQKDLHVEVHDNILTISGERLKRRRRGGGETEEYISFSRSISLPEEVNGDEVKAWYDDQQNLHIELPKKAEGGPKNIPIQNSQQQQVDQGQQQQEKSDSGAAPMQTEKTDEMKVAGEKRTSQVPPSKA